MVQIDDLLDNTDEVTSTGDFPDWWDPESEGDQLQGLVTDVREDPWGDDDGNPRGYIYHIKTEDGDEYSTRIHKLLVNLMEQNNVQVGDAVRLTFTGSTETDKGNNAMNYTLRHVPADQLTDDDGDPVEESSDETEEESSDEEESEYADSDMDSEVLEFAENIADFHGDDLTRDEFDKYLNKVREFGVDTDEVIEELDLDL